jgi:hypothetical protein
MSTTDLSKTAPTLVADGKGHSGGRRDCPDRDQAPRGAVDRIDAEEPPRLSRDLVHDAGCLGLLQRVIMQDETIHQEIPPADLLIRQTLGRYSSPSMESESIVV